MINYKLLEALATVIEYGGFERAGLAFGASLVLLPFSLLYSLYEIQISPNAFNVELASFEARKSAGREDVDYS